MNEEEDRAPYVIVWLGAAMVVAGIIVGMALMGSPARAADTSSSQVCEYTIAGIMPELAHPGTVVDDPDAVAALVAMLQANGVVGIPPNVTRVLVMVSEQAGVGYALEVDGCLLPPIVLPPGPPD